MSEKSKGAVIPIRKVVIEGLVEAIVSKYSITVNGVDIEEVIRKAIGFNSTKDYEKKIVRMKIEWIPIDTFIEVNGEKFASEVN